MMMMMVAMVIILIIITLPFLNILLFRALSHPLSPLFQEETKTQKKINDLLKIPQPGQNRDELKLRSADVHVLSTNYTASTVITYWYFLMAEPEKPLSFSPWGS